MKHAPLGYACPFCRIARMLPSPPPEAAVVLVEPEVGAFVPLLHVFPRFPNDGLYGAPKALYTT